MLSEIKSMPSVAKHFLANAPAYTLPMEVPYLGMGSSYFAPLAFKFMGLPIFPEMASEYYNYLHKEGRKALAVLLSQSGRSSEVLWCRDLFEQYAVIVNDTGSPLCKEAISIVPLLAGAESYSSSKTYINTLLALFKGFGMEIENAVHLLERNTCRYEEQGRTMAEEIFSLLRTKTLSGLYITGSGPNIATALQAALILSESTKLNFNGLAMAQYDHGPKETAKDSVVINIMARGKAYDRTTKLCETIKAAGAHVFTVEEPEATENESVLSNIIPFNYLAYYLSEKLQVRETFVVGGKVTEVSE